MYKLRYPHSCKYCKFSIAILIGREAFCRKIGRVRSNYICDRYIFDPFKYKVRRKRSLDISKFSKEDFEII